MTVHPAPHPGGRRPLRIVSLQPSISIVLDMLNCLDALVGCTRYCVEAVPALARLPVHVIHDSWSADTGEILRLQANLVLASVPYRMESLANILKAGITTVAFSPRTLDDIYADIMLLGSLVTRMEAAEQVVQQMQSELAAIRHKTTRIDQRPLVYCEEWGKPLIHSQHWVDELVEIAGGRSFGTPGATTDAETIRQADPDVMIFAWCGAGDRVPLEKLIAQRGWQDARAVRTRKVYCIRDEWLNTPAPSLVHGAWSIAAALYPDLFTERQIPRKLRAS